MKTRYTMKKRFFLMTLCGLFLTSGLMAQQLSSYQLYHMNPYLHSPASAGSKPYVLASAGYSQAWTGMQGAPNLQIGTIHALVSERVGVGGKIFYENSGLSGQFGAEATYAYHVPVGTSGTRFSFGLSAMLNQYSLHKDQFLIADAGDEVIENSENSLIVPDAALGLSLYKADKFYFHYGVYQLLGREVSFLNSDNLENKRVRHHFLQAGINLKTGEKLSFEPSLLMKFTEGGMFQADLGIKAIINKTVGIGAFYRTNEAFSPCITFDTKHVIFGYAYSFLTGEIKNYSGGSHEIMIILKINNGRTNIN